MCTLLITMTFKMGDRYKNMFVKFKKIGVNKFELGFGECQWLTWIPKHIFIWIVSFKINNSKSWSHNIITNLVVIGIYNTNPVFITQYN